MNILYETIFKFVNAKIKSRELNKNFNEYKFIQEISIVKNKYLAQTLPKKYKYSIAFIIPNLQKNSGGITSILRLGTYLSEFGHDISYITIDNTSIRTMKVNASYNLPYYKGQVSDKSYVNKEFDIGIATHWVTAYYLYGKENFLYKCYFVQDFEPAFYPLGDLYYLALNTFKFGYHMISLGGWNKLQIENKIKDEVVVDFVEFPVEVGQYEIRHRNIQISNSIKLAVYVKLDDRRAPILLFNAIDLLSCKLSKMQIHAEINVFGLDKSIDIPCGNNMGKLNGEELMKLYSSSDIGIVASCSNISLVPYEMIASGLPVIELADGSAKIFFDEDSMIFSESMPSDFCDKVIYYINNQSELNGILRKAQDNIETKTWRKSSEKFLQLITGDSP